MSTKNVPDRPDDNEPIRGEIIPNDNLPAGPVGDAGVLAMLHADDEWSDVDSGDLTGELGRIPYLALNRKAGQGFMDPDTGELVESMELVLMAKGRSRAQFDTKYDPKSAGPPDCRSFDGLKSDEQSPKRKQEDCTTCPYRKFVGDPDIDRDFQCHENVELLVFIRDPLGAGRLARLRFGGLGVAPTRAFWDSFQTRIPKRPPIAYLSRVTLEPTDTDYGKFLVPRWERLSEIGRAEAQPLIEERDRRLAEWKADVAADVSSASVASDVVDEAVPSEPWVDKETGETF